MKTLYSTKAILLLSVVAIGCSETKNASSSDPAHAPEVAVAKGSGDDPAGSYVRPWIYTSKATSEDWSNWDLAKRTDWCNTYYRDLFLGSRTPSITPILIDEINNKINERSFSQDLVAVTRTADLYTVRVNHKQLFP